MINWVYTGRLLEFEDLERLRRLPGCPFLDVFYVYLWDRWSDCYALADVPQDSDYKDIAVDVIIRSAPNKEHFASTVIESIYPYSAAGSAHRKLVVDFFTNVQDRNAYKTKPSEQVALLNDVVIAMLSRLKAGIPRMTPLALFAGAHPCKYHDHGSDKPCYKTKLAQAA
jgi:hypothetical protein